MKLTLQQLRFRQPLARVVIESVDLSLYIALTEFEGREVLVAGRDGRALRGRSVEELRSHFKGLEVAEWILRHRSAYDEMVGAPAQGAVAALEVVLGGPEQELPGRR